jgi:hypothetical protein
MKKDSGKYIFFATGAPQINRKNSNVNLNSILNTSFTS